MKEFEPTITWFKPLTASGDESDPANKLTGMVYIKNVMFHVEAVEVYYAIQDGEEYQESMQDASDNYFDEIMNIVQGPAATITIDGREYVLFITPSQA